MRLSVATNFDDELLRACRDLPVFEVYGKLPADFVGGGRASVMLSPMSRRRLARHVQTAHRCGLRFNYLLNAACLDNQEFTRRGRRSLLALLRWLRSIEVDAITVATPFLLEFVKAHLPEVKVRVSVFAEADHVLNVQHWAALGADSITLNSPFANREFRTLERIRDAVACDLQLLVNNSCIQSCPFTAYHKVLLAHASQSRHPSRGFYVDYCYLRCSFMKLEDPVNYIRSDWIRPEDLPRYEAMGYSTFKLTERNAPTDVMITRVRAYAERRYDGNLLDLVQPFGYRTSVHETRLARMRRRLWFARYLFRPRDLSLERLRMLSRLLDRRGMLRPAVEGAEPVVVDNRRLDGFLDGFPAGSCRDRDCEECRYCHRVAAAAVTIEPGYRDRCLELYRDILRELVAAPC